MALTGGYMRLLHRRAIACAPPETLARLAARQTVPVPALPRPVQREIAQQWRVVSVEKVPDPQPQQIQLGRVVPPEPRWRHR